MISAHPLYFDFGGTFNVKSKPISTLFDDDLPKVNVFVNSALMVTVADATPGTPPVTEPLIVALNPVAFDQLDVSVALVCLDMCISCSISPLLTSTCSKMPWAVSERILGWAMS